MKRFTLLLYLVFSSSTATSNIDTNYVKLYKEDFILKLSTSTTRDVFKYSNKLNQKIDLVPNQDLNVDIGLAYRWLIVNFSMKALDLRDNAIYGKSFQSRLGTQAFVGKSYFKFLYSNFKGFYISNIDELNANWKSGDKYPSFPNLRIQNFSLSHTYSFNGTRFSLKPIVVGNQVITKSCGSLLVTTQIEWFNLNNDSTIANLFNNPNDRQQLKSFEAIPLTLKVGYGYNFNISEKVDIIGSLTVGGGLDFQRYITPKSSFKELKSTLDVESFIGFMFNHDHWFNSITMHSTLSTHDLNQSSFLNLNNTIQLNIGYRFKNKKRLKWIGNSIGL